MKKKSYTRMNTRELADATKEFDAEDVHLRGAPLTPRQRQWFEGARRGRKRTGEGVKVISLSVEKGLLRQADQAARKAGVSRAQFVAEGLRMRLRKRRTEAAKWRA